MLKAFWFAMALTLCCTLGWSPASAQPKQVKVGIAAFDWLRGARSAAEIAATRKLEVIAAKSHGASIVNGKILLDRPIRITLPDGTKVEQTEFDIGTVMELGIGACLVEEKCRNKLDERNKGERKRASSGAMQE
ncbi:hypothetical protein [Bradyrhizobium liaoningense]|uniref:hypothetical protein n=1 Tax=Bradyrhizobium liaoningense TaxID=43992 RepID=UPI001BA7AA38|nr:hypothetical protein [Bradyrhizobium liaoningense]MBR0948062.1 hypothetical protein [Bradyrhizobium liaoningense]